MNLESKHTLFDSIDQMLAAETLSELLSKPMAQVNCSAPSVWGNAGSEFTFVDTNAERLVLKKMSIKSDWEMFATNDHLCRSVTLWQYGLLDQVRPHLEHKILACAHENDIWAILMQDLSGHFLLDSSEERKQELLPTFLDALAKLHAEFWDDPHLYDSRLGLDSPRILFQLSSPNFARQHNNDHWGWLPGGCIGGWEALKELLEPDMMSHMQSLIDNPQPLLDALNRYPHTLLQGDAYKNNLAYKDPNQAVIVDWQLAMRSLMTIDLARIVLNFSLDPAEQAQAQAYYRQRLEGYLDKQFQDTEWQAMIDLGILVEVLWITCYMAYFIDRTEDPGFKHYAEMRVKACNKQVRDGVRWINLS
jgi:hypothetical protein